MSRAIPPKASVTITAQEAQEKNSIHGEQGKLIFTAYQGHDCAMLLKNDRLRAAAFLSENKSKVGAIYIGKIRNVVKNLNACFVEIADREICFLPMKNARFPYLLNRDYDGRLLEGDELLVQVEREAQKTKQASVTAHVSLANDFFAIAVGSPRIGYSSKLTAETKKSIAKLFTERAIFSNGGLIQDVRNLLSMDEYSRMENAGMLPDSIKLPSTGCIVRTRAEEVSEAGLLLEQFFDIAAQYIQLLHTALHRSCFSCLKEAPSETDAVLGQLADEGEYQEIITDNEKLYEDIQKYSNSKRIRLYQDNLLPLSKLYSTDSRMKMALERRVWLKSGGYLIIEPTEALTVIDVNSGKYEAGKEYGETCRKINLEAAEEIALQLRLRNLSGMILVDFINMEEEEEKTELLSCLRKLVKSDKVKTTVVDMTPLGLVEITRKKVNKPLAEQWAAASGSTKFVC